MLLGGVKENLEESFGIKVEFHPTNDQEE